MELCFLSGWIIPKLMYRDNFEFNHTGKPLEVGFIIGADMLIRKDVFQQVDGFDARFFMYAEETDLSKRIYLLGYKSISVPEAKIIHLEGKSNKYKSAQMKMRYEGRMLYYKKYYSPFYIFLANSMHLLTIMSRILIYTIIRNHERKKEWKTNLNIFKELIF